MASLSPWPKAQFFDDDGNPLSGGKLHTYQAGTSTPLATYQNSAASVANSNPIILDSRGEANVWLPPGVSYKYKLSNSGDVEVWSVDNVSVGPPASSISVRSFGAVGDGIVDDTAACQEALDFASQIGAYVEFPYGTYAVNSIIMEQGCRGIIGAGTIVGTYHSVFQSTRGIITVGETTVPEDVFISIKITVPFEGTRAAIYTRRGKRHIYSGCFIQWLNNPTDTVNNHACFYAGNGLASSPLDTIEDITITNNFCDMPIGVVTDPFFLFGVRIFGEASAGTGSNGYFANNGVVAESTNPIRRITVTDNVFSGGTYGIVPSLAHECSFSGNRFNSPSVLGYLLSGCNKNIIFGEYLFGTSNSGFSLSYGSNSNLIYGCNVIAEASTGSYSLKVWTSSDKNLIDGCRFTGSSQTGIICEFANNNQFKNNYISGYESSAIALLSDRGSTIAGPYWSETGAPPTGNKWAFGDTQGNIFEDNVIGPPAGSAQAAIYISALTSQDGVTTYSVDNNVFNRNTIETDAMAVLQNSLAIYEQVSAKVKNLVMHEFFAIGMTTNSAIIPSGGDHFASLRGIFEGTPPSGAPLAASATPSVDRGAGSYYSTATSNIIFTDFIDGLSSQVIFVRFNSFTGIQNSANIQLNTGSVGGNVNPGQANSNSIMQLALNSSGVWIEISRNF